METNFLNGNQKVTFCNKYLQNFEGARTIYCRDSMKSCTFDESQLPEEPNGFTMMNLHFSKESY